MSFNSLEYSFFFIIVTSLFFVAPHRFRWMILLVASLYFYMSWRAEYILLILAVIIINYVFGYLVYYAATDKLKKVYLFIGVAVSLLILFWFKYINFLGSTVQSVLNYFGLHYSIPTLVSVLPVGISFYTFQALSYTIDIYREKKKPETHPGIFSLYVSFFPQLVAGPIERSTRLLPQFYEKKYLDYENIRLGGRLILWGLFKKIVVADRLGIYVDKVYNNQSLYSGPTLILATIFFGFQIYCDFSAYSEIAQGSAKIMGFDLMQNFRRPYLSKSVSEFWRRWHISLSTWFKDYLYIPLGGNRVSSKHRWIFNILVVFILSGLWHGAAWTFVLWGAFHGTFLVLDRFFLNRIFNDTSKGVNSAKAMVVSTTRILLTFCIVNLGWVLFRANTFPDALEIYRKLFSEWGPLYIASPSKITYSLFGFFIVLFSDINSEWTKLQFFSHKSKLVRYLSYTTAIMLILSIGVLDAGQFIYFQF